MVEQVALNRFSTEGLVKMLAVNVDQHLAEALQLLHRHGVAIDECSRPAIGVNDSPQQAFVVLVKRVFLQPRSRMRQCRYIELGAEFCTFGTASNELAATSFAEHEAECVDEYRLTGPCFTRQDCHAGRKLCSNSIDDRKIPNLQIDEHA